MNDRAPRTRRPDLPHRRQEQGNSLGRILRERRLWYKIRVRVGRCLAVVASHPVFVFVLPSS
jgi:hypothetical protein